MGTEMALAPVHTMSLDATRAYEPTTAADAWKLSGALFASGLMPRSLRTREAVFAVLIAGRELGLTSMAAIRAIDVIEGKTVLSSVLVVARVKRSPACAYWRVVESTAAHCTIETKRSDDAEPTRLTYTMEDARTAGLAGKDNWRKGPRAMLARRCGMELARLVYPEESLGLYDTDEIERPVEVVSRGARSAWEGADYGGAVTPEAENERREQAEREAAEDEDAHDDANPIVASAAQPQPEDPAAEEARRLIDEMHAAPNMDVLTGDLADRARALPKSVRKAVIDAYNARKKALGHGATVTP